MEVRRIVPNVAVTDPGAAEAFYGEILGLERMMDHGWIVAYAGRRQGGGDRAAQISFAAEGGAGTPVPDISVEVDDLDEALKRVKAAKIALEYGPMDEPWGVRRFYVRDPFGRLVNILAHA